MLPIYYIHAESSEMAGTLSTSVASTEGNNTTSSGSTVGGVGSTVGGVGGAVGRVGGGVAGVVVEILSLLVVGVIVASFVFIMRRRKRADLDNNSNDGKNINH